MNPLVGLGGHYRSPPPASPLSRPESSFPGQKFRRKGMINGFPAAGGESAWLATKFLDSFSTSLGVDERCQARVSVVKFRGKLRAESFHFSVKAR